mmetsp:Transcript_10947/g.27663  ORF Transcript_10947/g.27663 Transcript_10947/m.27663 type:complete len:225 (-) Transcript_10947:898-1572(-)
MAVDCSRDAWRRRRVVRAVEREGRRHHLVDTLQNAGHLAHVSGVVVPRVRLGRGSHVEDSAEGLARGASRVRQTPHTRQRRSDRVDARVGDGDVETDGGWRMRAGAIAEPFGRVLSPCHRSRRVVPGPWLAARRRVPADVDTLRSGLGNIIPLNTQLGGIPIFTGSLGVVAQRRSGKHTTRQDLSLSVVTQRHVLRGVAGFRGCMGGRFKTAQEHVTRVALHQH